MFQFKSKLNKILGQKGVQRTKRKKEDRKLNWWV